jgi:Tol biopolymer transport system component
MERVRIGTAMALLWIACACGSPDATGQVASTPSPSYVSPSAAIPSPSPSPTPSSAPEPLVLIPAPDGHTLVQSFADPIHPVTRYSLSLTSRIVKFISATEIGYTTNSSPQSPISGVTTIWRMSLKDMKPIKVTTLTGDAIDVTWSPDGSNVAFIAYPTGTGDLSLNQLWLKVGSAPARALTPSIGFGGRGVSFGTDEVSVRFSYDGKFLLMVDTFFAGVRPAGEAHFQVRSVPDGKLVWVPPGALEGAWTTMAVWAHSSNRLYYREAGVQTWDAQTNAIGTLAANVSWSSPTMSLDDRFVAYETTAANGKPHVEVRDLASGSVRVLPGILGRPTLLSDTVMIEQHFVVDSTGMGPPYAPDRFFVLNLTTNEETALPATFNCPLLMDASRCSEHRPVEVWLGG